MVTLFWRWNDSPEHAERRAPYTDLDAAKAQADHDLAVCAASDDFSTAPTRIVDEAGTEVWTADLPDGE